MMLLAVLTTSPAETEAPQSSGHPRDYLVDQHKKLVFNEAHRYKRQGVLSYDELVSEGLVALLRCVRSDSYDPAESAFSSYAVPSIRRQMWHAIRRREKDRIPQEPVGDRDLDHAPSLDTLALDEEAGLDKDKRSQLHTILAVVTEYERDLVHRRLVEEVSLAVIARQERKPIAEIRQIIEGAVYKLRLASSKQRCQNRFNN